MCTYLDAKAMAKSLRESLSGRNVSLSHSECLEIVARQFGLSDWNRLAAKLTKKPETPEQTSCSFCGKSQQDVQRLIEGACKRPPQASHDCVFICDECVEYCAQVNAQAEDAVDST
jgi:hypothetical protein